MSTLLHLPLDDLALPGSSLLPDVSQYRRVATATGGATLSSASSHFGGASALLPAGGAILVPSMPDTSEYTISGYFKMTALSGTFNTIFATNGSNNGGVILAVTPDGTTLYAWRGAFAATIGGFTLGAWMHVSLSVTGGMSYVGLNGAVSSGVPLANGSWAAPTIGRNPDAYNEHFIGQVDDFHVDSTALYTAPYTPPAAIPYTPWTVGFGAASAARRYSPYEDGPVSFGATPAPKRLIEDYYFGGRGKIAGQTKEFPDQVLAPRRVRLHRKRDGVLVQETWSAADGDYLFTHVDAAEQYYAVGFDHTGVYQGVVADNLTPEPM